VFSGAGGARKSMEISNLLTENMSDLMAANSDDPAQQTVPWSDSPWALRIMASLRALHAKSPFATNLQSSFDLLTLPLRQITLPVTHNPTDDDFQRGYIKAKALQEFLTAETITELSLPAAAASAATAGAGLGGAVGIAASTAEPAAAPSRKRAAAKRRESDDKFWVTHHGPREASNGFFKL